MYIISQNVQSRCIVLVHVAATPIRRTYEHLSKYVYYLLPVAKSLKEDIPVCMASILMKTDDEAKEYFNDFAYN